MPVTIIMHRPLTDPTAAVQVLKNLALIGGGLLLFAHGPNALSLDGDTRAATPEDPTP